jgi:hypothetical protein
MYLGFGPDAWDEFLRDPIESFIAENQFDLQTLPPENIFFLSISDWDWIVQALKDSKISSLKELLNKGKECNTSTNEQSKVFMMEQVLRKYYHVQQFNLSYLQEAHQLLDVLPTD